MKNNKQPTKSSAPENIKSAAPSSGPSVAINAQYVKDLSFENPNAPTSLTQQKDTPQIEVALDLEAKALQNDVYEITLKINASAKAGETPLFVAELAYSGIFTLAGIDPEQKEMILLIHCPTILFPFARRVLADVTRDGGFQPLMLDPIDFAALYQQRSVENNPAPTK